MEHLLVDSLDRKLLVSFALTDVSVIHVDHLSKIKDQLSISLLVSGLEAVAASPAASCSSDDSPSDKEKKPKKNRCHTCKKKVGLTGMGYESLFSGQ